MVPILIPIHGENLKIMCSNGLRRSRGCLDIPYFQGAIAGNGRKDIWLSGRPEGPVNTLGVLGIGLKGLRTSGRPEEMKERRKESKERKKRKRRKERKKGEENGLESLQKKKKRVRIEEVKK